MSVAVFAKRVAKKSLWARFAACDVFRLTAKKYLSIPTLCEDRRHKVGQEKGLSQLHRSNGAADAVFLESAASLSQRAEIFSAVR
jgi:hypothetical protein